MENSDQPYFLGIHVVVIMGIAFIMEHSINFDGHT